MHRRLMVGASLLTALLANLSATTVWAQPANPVFNNPSKSWIVRYGGDPADGNLKGDICVQLQISDQGGSSTDFVGTVYRYNSVKLVGSKIHYKLRSGPEGKQVFSGHTVGWDATKPRKPVRFHISTIYQTPGGDRELKIWGVYHAGKTVSGNNMRKDDRLAITLIDQPRLSTPPPPEENGAPSGPQPTPAEETVAVAYYSTFTLHPCEEDPDIDILEEDDFELEPEVPM